MSLIKYIHRLERMNKLISMRATGNTNEFARKMGICRSVLLDTIKDMRHLGAPISYCRYQETYYYTEKVSLKIDFLHQDRDSDKSINLNHVNES